MSSNAKELGELRELAYSKVRAYLEEVEPLKLSPTVVTAVLKGDADKPLEGETEAPPPLDELLRSIYGLTGDSK